MSAAPILANVLLFGRLLRSAGLPVTSGQTLEFARALERIDIGSRDQVFFAARALLVSRQEDLALFELLFHRFWTAVAIDPSRSRGRSRRVSKPAGGGAAVFPATSPEVAHRNRARTHSATEVLRHRDFADLTEDELEEVRRLLTGMDWPAVERRTRRWISDSRGPRLHLGRVLRDSARLGGVPIRLARRRRKFKRRPVVLLADVSGSMEKYSRILLQYFYGAVHAMGVDGVECFVFGTRLTRITAALRLRNVDRALSDAAAEIPDFSGGTRIGESLGEFNRRWARRVLGRGAVVLIASDGWERGGVSALGREMRYLQHRCHRLIWLNPHAGRPGYRPLVEGMRAALPFVDDFLPLHDLDSLAFLARVLAALPARSRARNAAGRREEGRGVWYFDDIAAHPESRPTAAPFPVQERQGS